MILYSHNIAPDAKHIHMPAATLEAFLKEAANNGVCVLGFDDLDPK